MHTSRRVAVVSLAASLAIAATLLTGCSLIPHPSGSGGISLPGVSVGAGHLPKDWPSDVPVVKGDVVSGASIGDASKGEIWNATIKVSGAAAGDEISAQLTGAGFTDQGGGSSDAGFAGAFQKDEHHVAVVVTKDDEDGWVADYTVTSEPG